MPAAKTTSLQHFFDYCVQNYLPVALYRIPGNEVVNVVAQKKSQLLKAPGNKILSTASGFVFAPFCSSKINHTVIISPHIFTTADKLPGLNFASKPNKQQREEFKKEDIKQASKQDYIAYVEAIQTQITKGKFKKVVAARVVKKKKPDHFSAVVFFTDLCKKYPNAFASLVYTPQYGLWIGATPEILLSADKMGVKTYSLAGTKANTDKTARTPWGSKELQEQRIVSQYIIRAFKYITETKPVIEGPETITAGNLLHLRTTITYSKGIKNKWPEIVEQLHPTPAVAGVPKRESVSFINKHEKAPRAFYSGYLGPVNLDDQINLFVNLRCMQVLKNKLAVYVGCGITADSDPVAEWRESQMKSQTLLSVLTC